MPNEAETVAPAEPELLSWEECEEKGWVLVHEGPWQNDFKAEKYAPNGTVQQFGASKENLIVAISSWEALQDSLAEAPPPASHEAIAAEAEQEDALRTVTGPDGESYTDAEWTIRDEGYQPTAEAHAKGQEAKRDAADEAAAVEEVETETLELSNTSNQPSDNLTVLPGEESINDVIARKAEQGATSESERAVAGMGIGPHGGENPLGGEPETHDPGPGLSETELAMQQEYTEQVEATQAARDAEGAAAVQAAEEAGEAAAEAEQAAGEATEASEGETQIMETNATPAAVAKAAELGVDLSTVSGTGADGKIVVGDVEDAAS